MSPCDQLAGHDVDFAANVMLPLAQVEIVEHPDRAAFVNWWTSFKPVRRRRACCSPVFSCL
jgi:hypothetical protein